MDTSAFPEREIELGGYIFRLPKEFAESEVRTTAHFSILKSAATQDITFDVFVVPGGGDKGIDDYFGTALRQYEQGRAQGFDLVHMGQPFRGWLIDQSPTLSKEPGAFIQFYGTVAYGDALCFSWASFAPLPEDANFETLFLTIVYSAIVRRGHEAARSA